MTIEEKIEEIAKEVGNNCVDFYANDVDFVCIEDGLRQIAIEQKKIDEEENGKALLYAVAKTEQRVKREMVEDACCILLDMALTKREEYKTYKEVITAFRKKLEE